MSVSRIRVRDEYGRKVPAIGVAPDPRHPGRIRYFGPSHASITPQEAIDLANVLADLIEGMEGR